MKGRGTHVADLLAEVFRRGGMKRALKRAEAVLLWPQVVGSEVARFTEAKTIQDGVLLVEVTDSETSMHLSLQRHRFLNAYRNRFGVKEIREIRFRIGLRQPVTPEPPPPPLKADPKRLSDLARRLGELDLPDSLAGPAMQTARALLAYRARREAQGWRPCRLCGTLTPMPEACDVCRRYAAEPRVQAAGRLLGLDPQADTPLLSEDERTVARWLARRILEESIQELLPQVLASPELRPQLEQVARSLLALKLGKDLGAVDEDDYLQLDARVARALGRWR